MNKSKKAGEGGKVAGLGKLRENKADGAIVSQVNDSKDTTSATNVDSSPSNEDQAHDAVVAKEPKKKQERKAPGNRHFYTWEEACAIVKLFNENRRPTDIAGV